MAILNYTTKISSDKTVGEIQSILGRGGAKSVALDYENRRPSAVLFRLHFDNGQDINFRLPCNTFGVLKAMRDDRKVPRSSVNVEQAERTAWRIIKDWVEAQLALIEAGQSVLEEVFLPYMVVENGQTLFQKFQQQQLQLTDGKK